MRCSNCGELRELHCREHVIPCCPGKCPAGPTPYSREYHVANIDRKLVEFAAVAQEWYERDREDPLAVYRIAARLSTLSRSLSAEAAAIAALDHKERNRHL